MRIFYLFCALFAARPGLAAVGQDEYRARRAELSKSLHDGVVVLFAATDRGEENIRTGFFQEPNFYYLSGWKEPGAMLLVGSASRRRAVLRSFPAAPAPGPGKVDGPQSRSGRCRHSASYRLRYGAAYRELRERVT